MDNSSTWIAIIIFVLLVLGLLWLVRANNWRDVVIIYHPDGSSEVVN